MKKWYHNEEGDLPAYPSGMHKMLVEVT